MDKIVNAIQNLSGSDSDLKNLKTILYKEETLIQKNLSVLDEVLNVLDPANHSLGWAHILSVKASSPKLDSQKFIIQVTRFISACNGAQIRLSPAKVATICHRFTEILVESNTPLKGIKVLRTAVKKMRPNSESLTPAHSNFLQICLLAKCYHIALPILEDEILEVNPDTTAVTPRDMLLYYYYGGMVYTGLKDYKKGFAFFKQAVSAPALVLSAIMVESYKKYILLSLLVHGKLTQLPRFTSSVVQRHHKTSFPQYHEFATAFGTQNTDDVHKVADQHSELFLKDRNLGLVKQCIKSLYRRNIQRFTQTYLTFSLQDIVTSVKLTSTKEAEKQIMRMIEAGEIFATINQKDGMVVFHENPEHYDTNAFVHHLDQQIQSTIDLGKKVRTVDESIASSANYLQKTAIHERGGNRWGGSEYEDFESEKPGNIGGKLM